MWCPSCGAEYRPGFVRCPDCDVALVDEPPPEPEPAPPRPIFDISNLGPELVQVWSGTELAAEMIRSLLEGSEIPSAVWGTGAETHGLTMTRVMVRPDDAERAAELIRATEGGDFDLDPSWEDEAAQADENGDDEGGPQWVSAGEPSAAPLPDPGPIARVEPWWRRRRRLRE